MPAFLLILIKKSHQDNLMYTTYFNIKYLHNMVKHIRDGHMNIDRLIEENREKLE
ncbi:MAG: hypothetical protein ACLS95_02850 [Clostridia bacterium]